MAFRPFAFEGTTNQTLEYMPLDVRRKLDLAGLKLSLAGWQALPVDARRALCDADERDFPGLVTRLAVAAGHPVVAQPPVDSWRHVATAADVPAERWAALDDAARYALWRLAEKSSEKLAAARAELVG